MVYRLVEDHECVGCFPTERSIHLDQGGIMTEDKEEITGLLNAWNRGDEQARERLVEVVYRKLREISSFYLHQQRYQAVTLQPTELLNEAYIKLLENVDVDWQNRSQFFAIAARLMRQVLVDYLREKYAEKRGGHQPDLLIQPDLLLHPGKTIDVLELEEALCEFEMLDPRKCRIVELRFFAGLNVEEVGEVLSISPSTVKREWRLAKAWLYHYLRGNAEDSES